MQNLFAGTTNVNKKKYIYIYGKLSLEPKAAYNLAREGRVEGGKEGGRGTK